MEIHLVVDRETVSALLALFWDTGFRCPLDDYLLEHLPFDAPLERAAVHWLGPDLAYYEWHVPGSGLGRVYVTRQGTVRVRVPLHGGA